MFCLFESLQSNSCYNSGRAVSTKSSFFQNEPNPLRAAPQRRGDVRGCSRASRDSTFVRFCRCLAVAVAASAAKAPAGAEAAAVRTPQWARGSGAAAAGAGGRCAAGLGGAGESGEAGDEGAPLYKGEHIT